MKTLAMILIMTLLAEASAVYRLRGTTWENDARVLSFSKDFLVELDKGTLKVSTVKYELKRAGDVTRLFLIVNQVRRGPPDTTLTLGVPFALLRYENKRRRVLLMKTMNTDGIMIEDYPLFPWPDFEIPWQTLLKK